MKYLPQLLLSLTPLLPAPFLAAQAQPKNLVTIDASAPITPPETGYLHMGGTAPGGHSLMVNSRSLVRDGKPWLPVMGELHYTRLPESAWEDEILKMKAGGVNIISTYVFWIHHEEVEGQFDWSGRRNLRHFVELCAKHQMYVYIRPGPWAHGEVRNGGFPDWLMKVPDLRTNSPQYLGEVAMFFNQIGQQLEGLMYKQGGPVVGVQLENEYGLHGAGRGAEHLLKLKQIALAAGLDPPLWSVTGWPSLDFPPQEVIPVSGGYPDGFWFGDQGNLPPSMNYLFNFNRELGDMGATVASEDPTGKVNLKHDPYFAAEEAGGMETAYHRRPILSADDIASLTVAGIGSGINLYGYYMYHGGTNPQGKLSTLQESVASGYPNDLPVVDYDFQAPLGAFGQERESYRRTRLMHLFLNAFGPQLATMPAYAPKYHSRDAANTTTPRVAVRTDGTSGFVFVNNYVRQLAMPARPGFQVQVKLKSREMTFPAKPLDVPAGAYFVWPFELPLGAAKLLYATAQLLTQVDTAEGKLVVFFANPGITPEFAFAADGVRSVTSAGAIIHRGAGETHVSGLKPGMNTAIEVTDTSGARVRVLLLTREQAEKTAVLSLGGMDHLANSTSSLLVKADGVHLRSTESPNQEMALLPGTSASVANAKREGFWTLYSLSQPTRHPQITVTKIQEATPRSAMVMGPYVDWRKKAVPTVPPDSAFDKAATWSLAIDPLDLKGLSELLLQVDYTGDIGRITSGKRLIDDNFFNGQPWQIGLKHEQLNAGEPLRLELLPMPTDSPIYLDPTVHLVRGGNSPDLRGVKLIPEYESVLPVAHQGHSSQ